MRLPPLVLAAALLAPVPLAAAQELRTLSPSQMEEDLFVLTGALEREHAGLTRFASREEIDEAFGEALYSVSEELDALAFYRVVTALLAKVHCGHTRAQLGTYRGAALRRTGILPVEVLLDGDRAWVLAVLSDDAPLEPGQELLAVDGLSIPRIRARAFAHLSGDGFVETSKERQLERQFAELYALLVEDAPHASHTVRVAGAYEPLEVAGISVSEWDARPPRQEERPLMFVDYPADDVARLFVRGFGDGASDEPTFPEQLETSFQEIRDRGIGHLVLDLRGNGGGRDQYGALLVSYFSPEPFGYFERIEVTAEYDGRGGIVEEGSMRLVTNHSGLQVQQPSEPGFRGEAFVLTDGWTFSTAADVATVLHWKGLATFVGEETGGGYDGNTSGDSKRITLPNSGLGCSVPRWMYTTANVGHELFARGVPPDERVRPTIEDALAGRDAELEHVLRRVSAE